MDAQNGIDSAMTTAATTPPIRTNSPSDRLETAVATASATSRLTATTVCARLSERMTKTASANTTISLKCRRCRNSRISHAIRHGHAMNAGWYSEAGTSSTTAPR